MMKMTGLSHLFKWENLHNWWLTKYFFAPLYISVLGFFSITIVRRYFVHFGCVQLQFLIFLIFCVVSSHK